MSKATKVWAIVNAAGRIVSVGMTQHEAWENAGRIEQYPAGWLEPVKGHSCIRVTITEEPTDE